jgi:hypothetical protein
VPSDDEANNVQKYMNSQGWICYYRRSDNAFQDKYKLRVQDLRRNDQGYGGSQIFTEATIGIYMGHGIMPVLAILTQSFFVWLATPNVCLTK